MEKKCVVVKIGSSSLTEKDGSLSREKLIDHVSAIVKLKRYGHDVVLVSSGAVSAGFRDLGYPSFPVTIASKQAAAAVGQGLLVHAYTEELKKHNIISAQMLLTRNDFYKKEQISNANATMTELLKRNVVPIINENDCVSIEELTFGDNDMLSALVSGLVHANYLILLTDINGVYDSNPHKDATAKRYNFLQEISKNLIEQTGSTSSSKVGTGGMRSKLIAAKTALSLGVKTFIGTGEGEEKLVDILLGKGDGTYVGSNRNSSMQTPKQWIALHSPISGKIIIDNGAKKAILYDGKSLLPAGLNGVIGQFKQGDVVEVLDSSESVIGKGQVNYCAEDLSRIKRLPSEKAMEITNKSYPEVIHRDNFVPKENFFEV